MPALPGAPSAPLPGFIDAHTHDDQALLSDPAMDFKVSQGVTTVVTGNCGISIAPLPPGNSLPAPLNLLDPDKAARFGTMRDYLAALDATPAAVNVAALVGHSWGSLIALEAAAQLKDRVTHLVLVGTAFPMKVSPVLIDNALNQPEKALQMINVFSRSTLAVPPSTLGPGTWIFGASLALGRRVLRSNPKVNVFHRGFKACNSYANGEQAIAQVTAPILFVLGAQDQMTLAKAAQPLIDKATATGKTVRVASLPVGHHQMTETPDATLFAIRDFLQP